MDTERDYVLSLLKWGMTRTKYEGRYCHPSRLRWLQERCQLWQRRLNEIDEFEFAY
jgi:hypothetical protein